MNRCMFLIYIIVNVRLAFANENTFKVPQWNVGDSWRIALTRANVRTSDGNGKNKKSCEEIVMTVLGKDIVKSQQCWAISIDYTPSTAFSKMTETFWYSIIDNHIVKSQFYVVTAGYCPGTTNIVANGSGVGDLYHHYMHLPILTGKGPKGERFADIHVDSNGNIKVTREVCFAASCETNTIIQVWKKNIPWFASHIVRDGSGEIIEAAEYKGNVTKDYVRPKASLIDE